MSPEGIFVGELFLLQSVKCVSQTQQVYPFIVVSWKIEQRLAAVFFAPFR